MAALRGLLRKFGSGSAPIFCKSRAFSSSSSTATSPVLLVPTRNLFSGEKNGKLSDSCYPYCLFSVADLKSGADTDKKKVLLPTEKLLPQDKELLFPDDIRYIGSSQGLVACLHPRSLKVFLFDPLSPSDSITLLPPIPGPHPRYTEYLKLIMSAPPSDPSCRVLTLDSHSNEIWFWTPGDQSWTPLPPPCWKGTDIVYSNRRQCFYITADGGTNLVAWDLSDPGSPKSRTIDTESIGFIDTVLPEYYLAESPSSGDLYIVWRSIYGAETEMTEALREEGACDVQPEALELSPEHMEHQFEVYKLDLDSEHSTVAEQVLAFDDALFLGKNHSFFWPAQPNAIYFAENSYFSYSQVLAFDHHRHRGCDVIKFGLDYSTSHCYLRDSEEIRTALSPIWVMPRSSTESLVERFVHTCHYKPPLSS